jgi:HPt (histidine-containing phosphotransfer) domain-containing protein
MFEGHAILDDGRLFEMVGGDEDFIVEILELYVQASGADVESLVSAVGRDAGAEASRLAHTLKGASGNVGADAMMDLCQRLELALKNNATNEVTALVAKIEDVFAQTVERIQKRIQS